MVVPADRRAGTPIATHQWRAAVPGEALRNPAVLSGKKNQLVPDFMNDMLWRDEPRIRVALRFDEL